VFFSVTGVALMNPCMLLEPKKKNHFYFYFYVKYLLKPAFFVVEAFREMKGYNFVCGTQYMLDSIFFSKFMKSNINF